MKKKIIRKVAKKAYRRFCLYSAKCVNIYEFSNKYVVVLIPQKSLFIPYNAYEIEKKTFRIGKHRWENDLVSDNSILESADEKYKVGFSFMGIYCNIYDSIQSNNKYMKKLWEAGK